MTTITTPRAISTIVGRTMTTSLVGTQGPAGPTGATGATGATGPGVPAGGAAGQWLKKSASGDYLTAWASIAASDITGLGALATLGVGAGLTSSAGNLVANVLSVAGRTGAVTLAVADVSGAAPTASPTFSGTVSMAGGALFANQGGYLNITRITGGNGIGFSSDAGTVATAGYAAIASSGLSLPSASALMWTSSSTDARSSAADLTLYRDAADTLAQYRGVNAQARRWYNTRTDASNGEWLEASWKGFTNYAMFGTTKNGTGIARALWLTSAAQLYLGAGNASGFGSATAQWLVSTVGHFFANSDNITDIGGSVSNRPRTVYAATSVIAQGVTANDGVVMTPTQLYGQTNAGGTKWQFVTEDGSQHGFLNLSSDSYLAFASGTNLNSSPARDTYLRRRSAANIAQGAADAASPVSQYLSVQNATGTNAAGVDRYYDASQGTGAGSGGSHVFRVAPAGSTGSAQNALVEYARLTGAGAWVIGSGANSPYRAAQRDLGGLTGFCREDVPSAFYAAAGNDGVNAGLMLGASYGLHWAPGSFVSANMTPSLSLWRDAANTLAQRNGVNAQTQAIYDTYTDTSNRRYCNLGWIGGHFHIQQFGVGNGATLGELRLDGNGIRLYQAAAAFLLLQSGAIRPLTDNATDFGASTLRFKDGWFAGKLMHGLASGAADPTTTDIAAGMCTVWKNTTAGEIRLWVNDAGVMKKSAALA